MKTNPKFAFFGTPIGAVYVLDKLKARGYIPSVIVTQPDSLFGRKAILTESNVAKWANSNNVECLKPKKVSAVTLPNDLEFILVASYGKIIPKSVLQMGKLGTFNIHPSLLPKHRGPTPLQSAIMYDDETGVSIMKLDELEDHGPIISKSEPVPIQKKNFAQLQQELFGLGAEIFANLIPQLLSGTVVENPQDHNSATFTKKFSPTDAFISPLLIKEGTDSEELDKSERIVRALNPEPGAWTVFKIDGHDLRVKILSANIESGKLVPMRVIPAGKKEMNWDDFLRGNRV